MSSIADILLSIKSMERVMQTRGAEGGNSGETTAPRTEWGIDLRIATKVLEVVDAGLVSGVGKPIPGQMCVEAAVCYALNLPHGDDPECVSRALRSLKIKLNDSGWSSNTARTKGLRRLALVQLGSRNHLDDKEFAKRVAELAIRKQVPIALRAAASINKQPLHKQALLNAANKCEIEGSRQSALDAREIAREARRAAYADAAADAAAAVAAAAYAATAADAATAAYAATAADAAAYVAAAAAADAAAAVAADAAAARDKILSDFAEDVVQILIDMKVPGVQWLPLTEVQP
jgi:hypothetical protein